MFSELQYTISQMNFFHSILHTSGFALTKVRFNKLDLQQGTVLLFELFFDFTCTQIKFIEIREEILKKCQV